jgi:hypothetical protein
VAAFAVLLTKFAQDDANIASPVATVAKAVCPYPAVVPPVDHTVFNVPEAVLGFVPTRPL